MIAVFRSETISCSFIIFLQHSEPGVSERIVIIIISFFVPNHPYGLEWLISYDPVILNSKSSSLSFHSVPYIFHGFERLIIYFGKTTEPLLPPFPLTVLYLLHRSVRSSNCREEPLFFFLVMTQETSTQSPHIHQHSFSCDGQTWGGFIAGPRGFSRWEEPAGAEWGQSGICEGNRGGDTGGRGWWGGEHCRGSGNIPRERTSTDTSFAHVGLLSSLYRGAYTPPPPLPVLCGVSQWPFFQAAQNECT